jgi:hypothetical protein
MSDILDYKKEYKDLYSPRNQPMIIEVPEMSFVAIEGNGNPNDENGEYAKAVEVLYSIQYTIKMSKKGSNVPAGYFDYVVPPLEGWWWFENNAEVPPGDKSKFNWLSMIRLPEYVNENVFEWACAEVHKKKKIETEKAKYIKSTEGLCVQCMHLGHFDKEPETIKLIDNFIEENNLLNDISETRRHHEIYLSNPKKAEALNMKTVLRIPVKRKR